MENYIYGKNSVTEALLNNPKRINKIFIQKGIGLDNRLKKIKELAFNNSIIVNYVDFNKFKSFFEEDVNLQGVIAGVSPVAYKDFDDFLKELGVGFTYVGSEVKIKMGDTYNYIDFLFFNTNYNCYVVIELKVTELKSEHLGQITKYVNYVNKNIKKPFHDNTVGVIICKKENKFVMEYCTNPKIFTTTYKTS